MDQRKNHRKLIKHYMLPLAENSVRRLERIKETQVTEAGVCVGEVGFTSTSGNSFIAAL